MGTFEAYGSTVINGIGDSYTEVAWSDWQGMSDQERAAIPRAVIKNVPGAEGSINAELVKLLWSNPSPSSSFAAQNVTLSSSDYDFLIVLTTNIVGVVTTSIMIPKGKYGYVSLAVPQTSNGAKIYRRLFERVSDTVYSISECMYSVGTAAWQTDNSSCIPLAIYGIKQSVEFKISAIAANVSTRADHCMLSDGVTSVEDVIHKGSVSVTADGTKTYKQLFNSLYALVDTTKISANSKLMIGVNVLMMQAWTSTIVRFSSCVLTYNAVYMVSVEVRPTNSTRYDSTGVTVTDNSSTVPASGTLITLCY